MKNASSTSPAIHKLPNNIYVVNTSQGNVVVNSPPETLKFLAAEKIEPPEIVVLPPDVPVGQRLGSSGFVRSGINYACVEFLLYANFFMQGQKKTKIVTVTDQQAARMQRILVETLVGPEDIAEYGAQTWLQQECRAVSFFQPLLRAPNVDDLVELYSLESGALSFGTLTIDFADDHFTFSDAGKPLGNVHTQMDLNTSPLTLTPPVPVQRQELTVQFIGASDGFDPNGITTCFLAYFGGSQRSNATLFDTAAYLRNRLGNIGISPRQISEVVVTHLHEDHLAGFPELLLMGETRIRVLTSDTIYYSLLRVMSAVLNVPEDEVAALFDYYPLQPGRSLILDGKRFETIYAIHSIPTLAIRINDLCYSGDMRYDEEWFEELEAEGILSEARRKELLDFANDALMLIQDVGGGTIHTSLTPDVLRALESKSKNLIFAHASSSKHSLPIDTKDLTSKVVFAGSGTVAAMGDVLPQTEKSQWVETISACPLYARLPVLDRVELAEKVSLVTFDAGEIILEEQSESDRSTYIVHDGLAEVWVQGERRKLMGRGTSIGERGALRAEPRAAAVVAQGHVELLRLPYEVFEPVARKLGLHDATRRAEWLWKHPTFGHLAWGTLLDLALDFQPRYLQLGECLFEFAKPGYECYLLISGKVMLIDESMTEIGVFSESGEFFGGRSILFGTQRNATACVVEYSEIWALPARALQRLSMVYPNVLLHLRGVEARRHGRKPLVSMMHKDTN